MGSIYKLSNLLNNFDLEIKKGSFIVITGPIASGKTTILTEINNQMHEKYKLSIMLDNPDYHFPTLKEELANVLNECAIPKKEIKARIKRVLKKFNIYEYMYSNIHDLSLVDKQRFNLALSTITNPDLLLLDNPFVNFSLIEEKDIINYLKNLCHKGMTIVITTHNPEECLIADKLLIVNKFNKVIYDKPSRIFSNSNILKKINIELPFMVDLSLKLKFYNLVKKIEIDMESMVDDLWK